MIYPESYMTVFEHELFDALKEMHACLNNRILGSGADAVHDEQFYKTCHIACEKSKIAIQHILTYYKVESKPAW